MSFMGQTFGNIQKYEELVQELQQALQQKIKKEKKENKNNENITVQRSSKFILKEIDNLKDMLSGVYHFNKIKERHRQEGQKMLKTSLKKMNARGGRHEALLGKTSKASLLQSQEDFDNLMHDVPAELNQLDPNNEEDLPKIQKLYNFYKPDNELDFRKLFWDWLQDFHFKFLDS